MLLHRFAILSVLPVVCLNGFIFKHHQSRVGPGGVALQGLAPTSHENALGVKVGDLLVDLPTPCLLMELSLAEGAVANSSLTSLEEELNRGLTVEEILELQEKSLLDGSIFVHTKVIDTSVRDEINAREGSGKSHVICQVDADPSGIPGGAYLGIGLANHHVGGYYWARGMGMGASLPAHGIFFRPSVGRDDKDDTSESQKTTTGELYWKKRGPGTNAFENTDESSNSNDGKRSEWADFVAVGDTVQLVPENVLSVLTNGSFQYLLGVRRIGRPLGADPIVERIWIKSDSSYDDGSRWMEISK